MKLEYTVIGDVVNVAARLETNATPGHALVAADMVAALSSEDRARVALGERRAIQVKGRSEHVQVVALRPASS